MSNSFHKRAPLLFILLILIVIASPFVGSNLKEIKLAISDPSSLERQIFLSLRLPRVILGFFAGGSLAICGGLYQLLFRTPLASPYTLGVSSGAALGAVLGIKFLSLVPGLPEVGFIFGVLGAALTGVIIISLGKRIGGTLDNGLLLVGIFLSLFFGSLIVFIQYLGDPNEVFRMTRWLMGSVETVGYSYPTLFAALGVFGYLTLSRLFEPLLVMSVGQEFAIAKGVNVKRTIYALLFITSLLVGTIVSYCGPIGFIGVAVPFIARRILGIAKEELLYTFLLGGVFLVVADTFGRLIITPAEIPAGVITALVGAPVFLWVILSEPKFSRE